jgi:hypothetical protein
MPLLCNGHRPTPIPVEPFPRLHPFHRCPFEQQCARKPEYGYLLDKAIADLKSSPLNGFAKIEAIIDRLLVLFGMEIL